MAVLVQSLVFVIMAQWFRLGGGVVHPLTRRYVLGEGMIKIGQVGTIISGDEAGFEVIIIDDSENTGGYLICTSRSFKQKSSESYDGWVEDYESLVGYFLESNWVVDWS
ncbi:TPA: hypothetical protein ACX3FR_004599 [Vibrio parahaemolyticus]